MRKMHAEELRQMTGCRYPVLVRLERLVASALGGKGPGAPFGRPAWDILVAALASSAAVPRIGRWRFISPFPWPRSIATHAVSARYCHGRWAGFRRKRRGG